MTFWLPYIQKKLYFVRLHAIRVKKSIFAKFSHEPYRLSLWLSLLLLTILILFIVDNNFSFGISFSEQNALVEIFSVTVSALAAILGIVIAFLIATFEMNKRYLSSNYSENLFKNDTLRGLVVLYLGTIIISLVGLIVINTKETALITNMIFVTSYLFIVCIVVLIPRMRQLVAETNTSKEIARIAEEMIGRVRPGYFSIGEAQLNLLMEAGKKASAEGEEGIVIELINVLNDKFDTLSEYLGEDGGIMHRAQPRDMATSFSSIFYVLGIAALTNRQLNITDYASSSMVSLMRVYASKHQLYFNLIESEKYFIKLIKAVIADGNDELATSLIYDFQNFIETQFKDNMPPAEELSMFEAFDKKRETGDVNYDLNNHWHHISSNYAYRYRDLIKHAIKHNNIDALQTLLSSLQSLSREILTMENLTDEHKRRTAGPVDSIIEGGYREAIDNNIITRDNSFMIFMLDPHFDLADIIKDGKNYSVWNLQRVANVYLYAAEKGVLPADALNNLGTTGRTLKRLIKESELAAHSVVYIVAILGKIKDLVVDNVDKDPWSAQIYVACYDQAISIRRWDKKTQLQTVTVKLNKFIKEYDKINNAKAFVKTSKSNNVWDQLFEDK